MSARVVVGCDAVVTAGGQGSRPTTFARLDEGDGGVIRPVLDVRGEVGEVVVVVWSQTVSWGVVQVLLSPLTSTWEEKSVTE